MAAQNLSAGMLLALLTFPAVAQNNILFAEDFNSGIPAGWTHRMLGASLDPWYAGTSPATNSPDVFHEWYCAHGTYFRNNVLISPRIDLTGFSRVDFSCVQYQWLPQYRFSNRVEVSTNGGQSFQLLYAETGTWSGPGTINASLDAWAGLPDVRIAFHYQGVVANEWRIDDVRVTTPQPILDVNGGSAGATTTFAVNGCAPGAFVLIAVSFHGNSPLPTPYGIVHLSPPIHTLPFQFANGSGHASSTHSFPAWATGLFVHAHAGQMLGNGSVTFSNWRTITL